MKNKNLQELFDKVMQEERSEINSLDEKSSQMIKGGTGVGVDEEAACGLNFGCSKIGTK